MPIICQFCGSDNVVLHCEATVAYTNKGERILIEGEAEELFCQDCDEADEELRDVDIQEFYRLAEGKPVREESEA